MKVSVIGNGHVGMAAFSALKNVRGIDELALVGRNVNVVQAEVEDFLDARILDYIPSPNLIGGGLEKSEGSDIIIYTVGELLKAGADRLSEMESNVKIVRELFPKLAAISPNSIVICLSNPVDVLTYVIREAIDFDQRKVIGSGTLLDTARLKRKIADLFNVSALSVDALIMGEHGQSAAVIWSAVRIANQTMNDLVKIEIDEDATFQNDLMSQMTKRAGFKIYQGKGNTSYGIANSAARIVSAIINDTREVLPVSTMMLDRYGIRDCALSVPCVIGQNGIVDTVYANMTQDEKADLEKSAEILKEYIEKAKII